MVRDNRRANAYIYGAICPSRGIGAAVAKAFAAEGAHVVLAARTVGGLEAVDDDIQAAGGTATLTWPADAKAAGSAHLAVTATGTGGLSDGVAMDVPVLIDLTPETTATGGGCDANVLNQKGLQVANLATGMREIHTVNEWLDLRDLNLCAAMVLEIVRVNARVP